MVSRGYIHCLRHALARGLILAAFLLCAVTAHAAASNSSIEVSVDRDRVSEGESFVLTFHTETVDHDPDFTPLHTDFDVLGTSRRSDLSLVNGRFSKSTTWQVNLMAKRSGELRIPAIAFGDDVSPPLTITVTPAVGGTRQNADARLFFEVHATPERPYVQSQVVYTIQLHVPEDLELVETNFSEPRIMGGDALVLPLGKPRERDRTRDGKRYRVLERSYAIFPQRHGKLTIEPIVFDGRVIEGAASLLNPFSHAIRSRQVRSDPVELDVRPVPAAFQGKHWLPAEALTLHETWSDDGDSVRAGEPVTRTLSLLAKGLSAGQLPELVTDLPGALKIYPEAPVLDDQLRSDGVTGLRQEKVAIIASANGTYALPEVRVPWWNTKTERLEEAVSQARTVRVFGATASTETLASTTDPSRPVTKSLASKQTSSAAVVGNSSRIVASWWPWVALLLAAGWATTLLLWALSARRRTTVHPPHPPDLNMLALRVVTNSRRHDAAGTRAALLAWAAAHSTQPAPRTLESITRRYPTLATPIETLGDSLFGPNQTVWNGDALAEAFAAVSKNDGGTTERAAARVSLAPLYLGAETSR